VRGAELEEDLTVRWELHQSAWRRPEQITSHWRDASAVDASLLRGRASRGWWDVLERSGQTLIVTREYEHLVMALTVVRGRPRVSYMPMPHPSGVAYDADGGTVHLASTRNPNQIFDLRPVTGTVERSDVQRYVAEGRPLVPIRSRFLPGCMYMHDLALIGGRLHGNAVGLNAVVRLGRDESPRIVWWPHSIEHDGSPDFTRNYLQLNSIAAGRTLGSSFFTASAAAPGRRRPGHRGFAVDGRGVVFSGKTRAPVASGLTRPHSARLLGTDLWVDNSGYGELGVVRDGRLEVVARVPGWTRGLGFAGRTAFVGVSRVIPRFAKYAPGLDVDRSVCGVFAVDTVTGQRVASVTWPVGNQIFGVECVPREFTLGFPLTLGGGRRGSPLARLFYSYTTG
jgi:uncharacterized protein (TIGR03032 family)